MVSESNTLTTSPERIELNQNNLQLEEGQKAVLSATVYPLSASQKVIWTSSNPIVASVSDGLVTALNSGESTITVISEMSTVSATCSVSVSPTQAPSVTLTAESISAIGAVLCGKANIGSSMSADIVLGMAISKSAGMLPGNSEKIEAQDVGADYSYSIYAGSLEPGETYYYRSYISQAGIDTYGDIKSFQTLYPLVETVPAEDITAHYAVLRGKANVSEEDKTHRSILFGFLLNHGYTVGKFDADKQEISAQISVNSSTNYVYCADVTIDGTEYKGKELSFYTPSIPVESVSLDKHTLSLNYGSSGSLQATVMPNDASDKSLRWSSSNWDVASIRTKDNTAIISAKCPGVSTITAKTYNEEFSDACEVFVIGTKVMNDDIPSTLEVGDTYQITATVYPESDIVFISSDESVVIVSESGLITAVSVGTAIVKVNDQEIALKVTGKLIYEGAVDLGLSVKWAACNLGADHPGGNGDLYAWGETSPKENYTWETYSYLTYRYLKNDTYVYRFNKYNSPGNYVLESADDAASVNLGGGWRMPTQEEYEELLTNCIWERSSIRIPGDWQWGYRITSKETGKSIFLPDTRGKDGGGSANSYSSIYGYTVGIYWTSSIDEYLNNYAHVISNTHSIVYQYESQNRYCGLSIRPVIK